jgi:hypothetical protein
LGSELASLYKLQFKELIRLEDRAEYNNQYKALKDSWDPLFAEYYKKFIDPKIDMSGWWSAKACGWRGFTTLSIWTSNQAEAANRQYRERLEFKSATIVETIRHFDDWQRSTLNEMARAFMGQGNYGVVDKFRRDIVIKPKKDECSLCRVKSRANWCRHLVVAGMKLSPLS